MKDAANPTQITASARSRVLVASFLMLATTNCSSGDEPQQEDFGSSAGTGGIATSAGGTAAVSSGGGSGDNSVGSAGGTQAGAGSGGSSGIQEGSGAGTSIGGAGSGGDSGYASGGAASATGGSGSMAGEPILPPVDSVETDGPFMTTVDQNTGPSGSAWVARPSNLGEGSFQHPIFLWGPGAGTTPSTYATYLTHWASHGFVVYSIVSTGDGSEMIAGMDWLVSESTRADSPYFGKLDVSRIAAGGHSRGSLSAFGAASDGA